ARAVPGQAEPWRLHDRHPGDARATLHTRATPARRPLYAALTSRGLRMPAALAGVHGSDLAEGKRYDQILYDPRYTESFAGVGGVLDFYGGDHRPLYPRRRMTKEKFTFQMSDH